MTTMIHVETKVNKFFDQLRANIKEGKNEETQRMITNVETSDLIDSSGKSLLHWSVTFGNEKITQFLIDSGYNVDIQDNDKNTPLLLAVDADNDYLIEMLITAGADIHICNIKDDSPVRLVLKDGILPSRDVIKLFLCKMQEECGTNKHLLVDKLVNYRCPLYFAVLLRDAEITRMMLDRGFSVKARCPKMHDTSLHEAVAQSDLANVKLLVERGACVIDLGYQNEPPLCRYNVWNKDTYEKIEMLKFLVTRKSPLYYPSKCPPLKKLFKYGNKETVCTLLRIKSINLRFKYNNNKKTALHLICSNKNPGMAEAIKLLQGKDFDIDAVDKYKWTALMTAASRRSVSMVECLLEMGANVNICNEFRLSVLHEACRNECRWIQGPRENNGKVVSLLLQYGLDVLQSRDRCGEHFLTSGPMKTDSQVAKNVLERLAQMETLGEFGIINNVRQDIIEVHRKLEEYYVSCLKQLHVMKSFKLYGSVTILDLLNGNEKNLDLIVRNHNFEPEFSRIMTEKHDAIPNYYSATIRRRVAAAITRVSLVEKAANVICRIIGLTEKHIVAYEVVYYLKSQDLMNLIEIN